MGFTILQLPQAPTLPPNPVFVTIMVLKKTYVELFTKIENITSQQDPNNLECVHSSQKT